MGLRKPAPFHPQQESQLVCLLGGKNFALEIIATFLPTCSAAPPRIRTTTSAAVVRIVTSFLPDNADFSKHNSLPERTLVLAAILSMAQAVSLVHSLSSRATVLLRNAAIAIWHAAEEVWPTSTGAFGSFRVRKHSSQFAT